MAASRKELHGGPGSAAASARRCATRLYAQRCERAWGPTLRHGNR